MFLIIMLDARPRAIYLRHRTLFCLTDFDDRWRTKKHYGKLLQKTEIYSQNTESIFMGCTGLVKSEFLTHVLCKI